MTALQWHKKIKQMSLLDEVKFNMGQEILGILSMANAAIIRHDKTHKPKGIYSILNMTEQIQDMGISAYKFQLKMKVKLFGKPFIDECLVWAIELSKKVDFDIMKEYGLDKKFLESISKEAAKGLEVKVGRGGDTK